jgi:hypothetical protein
MRYNGSEPIGIMAVPGNRAAFALFDWQFDGGVNEISNQSLRKPSKFD